MASCSEQRIPDEADELPELSTKIILDRADKAAAHLNGKRCLISNAHPDLNVQHVHLLSRETDGPTLRKLEIGLGLLPKTISVDSRYNIMRLTGDLRALFENGSLILLPEKSAIKLFESLASPEPDISKAALSSPKQPETYKYKLIATKKLREMAILRYPNPNDANTASTITVHLYPFADFPIIASHVRPFFVICDIGRKLSKCIASDSPDVANDEDRKLILKAFAIYQRWMGALAKLPKIIPDAKDELDSKSSLIEGIPLKSSLEHSHSPQEGDQEKENHLPLNHVQKKRRVAFKSTAFVYYVDLRGGV